MHNGYMFHLIQYKTTDISKYAIFFVTFCLFCSTFCLERTSYSYSYQSNISFYLYSYFCHDQSFDVYI